MTVALRCFPHWQVLEDAAIAEWQAARQRGEEPLFIVPSVAMRDYWLSRLSAEVGGVHGDAVTVLDYLAQKIAAEQTDGLWRLARPVERHLAALEAFATLVELPTEWHRSGIVDAFLDAVEELELHALTPEEVGKVLGGDERIDALTQAWQFWKKRLKERGLWSIGDALRNAIYALRNGSLSLSPTSVFVYGFTALTDLRWEFLHALLSALEKRGDMTARFFVPYLPDNERACGYAKPLVDELTKTFGISCGLLPCDLPAELQAIPRGLFRWQRPKDKLQLTDRILYGATAGEEQEVEMVLRLLTKWRREGVLQRYGDALLLARSLDAYLPALDAVSARYEVPFVIVGENERPAYSLIQLLWSIADARRNGLSGETLWRVIPSPYLRHFQSPDEPLLPTHWHAPLLSLVRQRLAETGAMRWTNLLSSLDAAVAKNISDFLQAVEALPLEAASDDHAKAWQRLLTQFVRPTDTDEEKALRKLHEQLNVLQGWTTCISLEEFVALLEKECILPINERRDALRVASIVQARGLWASAVIVLGMSDELFPQTPPVFELLTDDHRNRLKERYNLKMPLKFRREFLKAERMLFMEAVGAATERLALTHPRTDAEGKPRSASVFLDATDNALKAAGFEWRKEERDLADVLPRELSEVINTREAETLALFEVFPATVDVNLPDDGWALTAALLRDDAFRERLQTEWLRWMRPQEGFWDGKGLTGIASQIVERLQTQRLHVTALEDYGHCPYRFFAKHILRLERPEEVTYTLDARTVGVIWHRIMERFLRRWIDEGQMPDEQTLQEIAEQIVDERTQDYPEQVRALLREQALTALPRIWQAEQNEAKQWTPLMVEKELSLPAKALGDVPNAFHDSVIAMRPDRVDKNEKGELRVADYKTGGVPGQADIKNGVALQLPFYALAVTQSEGQPVSAAHFIKLLSFTQRGYSIGCTLSVQPKGKEMLLAEATRRATEWVRQFLQDIAAADFTVRPFDFGQSCRSCDFKALCRRHPLRIAERGKGTEISADD